MLKRGEILEFERQLEILEKESKVLKESFNSNNLEKFKKSKQNLLEANKKIRRLIK